MTDIVRPALRDLVADELREILLVFARDMAARNPDHDPDAGVDEPADDKTLLAMADRAIELIRDRLRGPSGITQEEAERHWIERTAEAIPAGAYLQVLVTTREPTWMILLDGRRWSVLCWCCFDWCSPERVGSDGLCDTCCETAAEGG